jgi:hypothetical protein
LFGVALLAALTLALVLTFSIVNALLPLVELSAMINVARLIDNIGAQPGNLSRLWVYFTLLSTLLPSFFNLLVGVFSLLTFSVPTVRHWLIETIPTLDNKGMEGTRWLVIFALSAHWFFGVALTGLGLWFVWQIALTVPYVEPTALGWLHAFAIWCAQMLSVPGVIPT